MATPIPVAELRVRGVELESYEAVAITQRLIEYVGGTVEGSPRIAEPGVGSLSLRDDGELLWLRPASAPTVEAVASLLQNLLPIEAGRAPAGLRYAVARGRHDVDAPPFDSLEHFSRTIVRFENGERGAVLRSLAARVFATAALGPAPASTRIGLERRRTIVTPAELRRDLREADLRLYRMQTEAPSSPSRWRSGRVRRAIAAAAAALLLVATTDHGRWTRDEPSGRPVARVTASPDSQPREQAGTAYVAEKIDDAQALSPTSGSPAHPPRHAEAGRGDGSPELLRAVDRGHRHVFSPAFDARGETILFHTGGNADPSSALMAAAPADGEFRVRTLVDDGSRNYHVKPSPDGRLIAFDSDRDGARGVYVADHDGTNARRVSGAGYAAIPSWAPEGRRLAFVRAEASNPNVWNLWLLSLDSGNMQRLTRFRYGQTWSGSWFPDGQRLCFTHEDRLAVLDLATGRSREYRSPVPRRLVRTPAVAPDGLRVIFQIRGSGAWVLDLRDASMERVLEDPTAEEFAWSPDGGRVAFHSRRDGQWAIWTMPADGAERTPSHLND